jgi:hypothetical protein
LTGKQAVEATHAIFQSRKGNHDGVDPCRPLTVEDKNAEKTCVIAVSGPNTSGARIYQTVEPGKPSSLHAKPQQTKRRHIDRNGGE